MIKNIKKKINNKIKDNDIKDNDIKDNDIKDNGIKDNDIKDINQDNYTKEKDNLKKIKIASEIQYKTKIKINMIEYIKKNNNDNINYEKWLKKFNISDWEQEFNNETDKRENKIYHIIWDNLTMNDDFIIIY